MEKIRNFLLPIFIFAFLFICVFDPTDPYHLKLIFYFISLVLGADILVKNLGNKYYLPIYLMGLVYPIITTIWSTVLTGSFVSSAQQAYPAALILLVILIKEKNVNYEKWLMGMLSGMAIFILVISILDLVGVIDVKNLTETNFWHYLRSREIVSFSHRKTLCFDVAVFFKSGLLMTSLLAFLMMNKKWICSVFVLFALAFSSTRANLMMGLFIVGIGIIINIVDTIKFKITDVSKQKKIIELLFFAIIIVAIPIVVKVLSILHSQGLESDSLKYAQGMGILEILKDPKNFFLGQGFGSYFPDMGRDGALFNTAELNYLDFFRKAGLILSIPFFAFIFLPFTWKISWDKKVALLAYLIISATNPYLYTSTAFVLYIYIYINRPENTWFSTKFLSKKQGE